MAVGIGRVGKNKWKVRWRCAWTQDESGMRRRPQGSTNVHSREAAIELAATIQRALDTTGTYDPTVYRMSCNLERAAMAWIVFKTARGCASGTRSTYASACARIFKSIRELNKLKAEDAVPAGVLSRDLFTELLRDWERRGLSDSRRYDLSRVLFEIWLWAADDPARWPGIPTPPRLRIGVIHPAPIKGQAGRAPRPAEMDEIVRRAQDRAADHPDLRDVLLAMRLTGLRARQVLGWRVRDFDVRERTLRVLGGKAKKDKQDQRVVPVPTELVTRLGDRLTGPPEALVFAGLSERVATVRAWTTQLWEAATEAGVVDRQGWAPPNRGKARPLHAFRAGYLAALKRAGVEPEVRHALVGHTDSTTEGRSYAGPEELFEAMRSAVDAIPPLALDLPLSARGNTPPPKRATKPRRALGPGGQCTCSSQPHPHPHRTEQRCVPVDTAETPNMAGEPKQ